MKKQYIAAIVTATFPEKDCVVAFCGASQKNVVIPNSASASPHFSRDRSWELQLTHEPKMPGVGETIYLYPQDRGSDLLAKAWVSATDFDAGMRVDLRPRDWDKVSRPSVPSYQFKKSVASRQQLVVA